MRLHYCDLHVSEEMSLEAIVDDGRRTTDDARRTTHDGHWLMAIAHHEPMAQVS